MSTESAAQLAMTVNFVTLVVLALWRYVPWSRERPLTVAATPLVAIHTARTIALQLYSSQANGFEVSDGTRNEIIWGDFVGAVLALATLLTIWLAPRYLRPIASLLVVVTVIDLANALIEGIREELLGKATDVSWLILTFYVPLLWVTIGLLGWLILTRRGGPIGPATATRGGQP